VKIIDRVLLNKLDRSAVIRIPNNLIKSFLSDRTQRVKIDDTHESIHIICGVLRCTVQSPLLFIIILQMIF